MPNIQGLYAITPETIDTEGLVERVRSALRGGARVLQYRAKRLPAKLQEQQAKTLAKLCRGFDAIFVVNDNLDLALKIDAHGVHLGKDDLTLREARKRLGSRKIIGVSCYDRLELALTLAREGADYVAFGSFFPSSTKPNAVRPPLSLLSEAKRIIAPPVVAIGGITPENAATLVAAGADSIAVLSALFDAPDIEECARRFSANFLTRKRHAIA
jgi:thiamine-phosphate pyrophosphorylase